ncbi:MAG: carboxypeptidase regulatory-like domain-containing protein, partial [Myxococcota bacterium]
TGVIIDAATMRAGTGPENGRDALDGILPLGMVAGFDPDTEADVTVVADGSDGAEAVVRARARPRDLLRALEALGGDITPFSELVLETDYRLSPGDRHVVVRSRLINESTQFQPLDGEVLRRQLDMAGASATGEVDLLMGDALITGARSQNFVPTAVPDEDGELLPVGFDIESGHRLGRRSPPGLPGLPGMFTDMVAAVADGVSYGWAVRSDENNAVERSRLLYASTGNPIPADAPMVVSLAVEGAMAVHHTVLPDVLAPGGSFEFERYFLVGTGDVSTLRAELTRIRNQGTGVLSGEIVRDPGGGPVPDARLVVLDGAQRPFSSAKTDELGRFRIVLPEGAYFVRAIAPGAPPTALEASFSSGIDIQAGQGLYRRIALTAPAGVSVRVRDTTGRAIPAKVSVVGSYDPTGRSEPVSALINSLELGDERRATDLSERRSILARTNEYVEAVGWGGEEDVRLAVRPTDCDEVESCSTGARVGPYRIVVSRGPEYTIGEVSGVELIPGEIKSFEVTLRRTVDTEGYLAVDFDMKTHSSPDGVWSPAERARAAGAEGLEAYFAADTNRLGAASSEAQRAGVQTWIQGFDAIELTTLERGANIVLPMERNDIRESGLPDDSGCIAGSGADTLGFLVGRFECGLPQLFSRTRSLSSRDPAFSILLASHPRRGIQGQLNQMGVNGVGEAVIPVPLNDRWLGWPLSAGYRDGALSPVGLNLGDLDGRVVWHGKATPTLRDFRPPSADQLDPALSSDVLLDLRNYQCADGHPNNALGGVVLLSGGGKPQKGPLEGQERGRGSGGGAGLGGGSGGGG